jgi:hypothetical protein
MFETLITQEEAIFNGHLVCTDQVFLLAVWTVKKTMKDDSYFSFISLFDLKVSSFIHSPKLFKINIFHIRRYG